MPHLTLVRPRTAEPGTAEQAADPRPGSCDLLDVLDALDVPLTAGLLALDRMDRLSRPAGAVWTLGDRLLLPLPPGAAAELPGLLCWLGWAHLDGVLRGRRAGAAGATGSARARRLRGGAAPGPEPLVRLVDTCADACARLQLAPGKPAQPALRTRQPQARQPRTQPCAFSYASRMLLGTRPRSLTS